MRLHRDGYIQASHLEVKVPAEVYRRANSAGMFWMDSLMRTIGDHLGLVIEDVERSLIIPDYGADGYAVDMRSSWHPPSRR